MTKVPSRTFDQIQREFGSRGFDPQIAFRERCARISEVSESVQQLSDENRIVHEVTVDVLRRNSGLFSGLTELVSQFDREFSDLPNRIQELQKLVNDAQCIPVPGFDEVPPIPKSAESDIVDKPHWLTNAPRKYEALMQQHRNSEAIDLLARCADQRSAKVINDWFETTRLAIRVKIQDQIQSESLGSRELVRGFRDLEKLGYGDELMDMFFGLATRSLDASLSNVSDLAKLARTLCSELARTVRAFRELWNDANNLTTVAWVLNQLEQRMPIADPGKFIGHLENVRNAIDIMKHATKELDELGISTGHLFDAVPRRIAGLLAGMAVKHSDSIRKVIDEKDWDTDLDDLASLDVSEYPRVPALEVTDAHVKQFCKEIEKVYEPEMFYECADSLYSLVKAFTNGCTETMKEERHVGKFCVVLVQLYICEKVVIPRAAADMERITGYPFPNQSVAVAACHRAMSEINGLMVDRFLLIWRRMLANEPTSWTLPFGEAHPGFMTAIDTIMSFLSILQLPPTAYDEAMSVFVEKIIKVIEETGQMIEGPEELASFDFHWTVCAQMLDGHMAEVRATRLLAGLKSIGGKIASEAEIRFDQRIKAPVLNEAARKVVEARKKEMEQEQDEDGYEEEEEDDNE